MTVEESLETLPENSDWLYGCDAERKVVPHVGAVYTENARWLSS